MSNLKTSCKVCPIAIITLLLSGCEVVLINPLSDSAKERQDERLLGRWINKDEKDKGEVIQFDNGARREINVSFLGGEAEGKNPIFTAFTMTIGGHRYLSLNPTDEDKGTGYLLVKYEIKDDKMSVWMLDSKKIKAAIEQRKLKGDVGPGFAPSITITDTPDNVRALLESPAGGEMFEYLATFERIKTK